MMSISTRTLWRLAGARRIPAPIRLKGSTRWRRIEVERWIEHGCPSPEPSGDEAADVARERRPL